MLHAKAYVDTNEKSEEGVLTVAVGSTAVIDRAGEVIKQDGWDLRNFENNSPLLWAHNVREQRPPIGKVEKVWFEGEGNDMVMKFSPRFDMEDEFAKLIYSKYQRGFLNAFSVGFIPIEQEGNTYTKAELIEISAVPVPANPEALVELKGIETTDWNDLVDNKSVIPYKNTEAIEETSAWDASGAIERVKEWAGGDMNKYKQAFAWFNSEAPDDYESYKLLHHDVVGIELKTNWRGVAACMGVLMGANEGAGVPDADRKGIYNHLSKHYKQYEKEAPEFRMVESQVLKQLAEEIDTNTEKEVVFTVETGEIKSMLRKEIRSMAKKKESVITNDEIYEALKIINRATNRALSNINAKGGETYNG